MGDWKSFIKRIFYPPSWVLLPLIPIFAVYALPKLVRSIADCFQNMSFTGFVVCTVSVVIAFL